jgi:hypothetical protein
MARVFGFSFRSPWAALAFAAALAVLALLWHTLIERSIRRHPDSAWQTVREHCRFRVRQGIRNLPSETVTARLAGCERFQVRTIEASGGLIRPVMLKVTLDASPEFAREGTRSLPIWPSATACMGWPRAAEAINHFNTCSNQTFMLTH